MSFDEFWRCYPHKVSKGHAMKAWKALNPDAELVQKILAAIETQMLWRKRVLEFNARAPRGRQIFLPELKYPATWIRAMCWEDELPEIGETQKPKPQKTMCACKKEEGKYPIAGVLYCIKCYDRAAHPENYPPKLRIVK